MPKNPLVWFYHLLTLQEYYIWVMHLLLQSKMFLQDGRKYIYRDVYYNDTYTYVIHSSIYVI